MSSCCPTNVGPVLGQTYQSNGKMIQLSCGVNAYLTGTGCGYTKAILATYDIFGHHDTTHQTCDLLSKAGYVVLIPDYFQGKPWPMEPWPPTDFGPLLQWIGEVGTYDVMQTVMRCAVEYLQTSESIRSDKIGGIGFCWGAKPTFAAQAAGLLKAIAAPHPSFLNVEDAQGVTAPVCLLPTKDDPPMEDIKAVLCSNKFSSQNVFQRFDEMHHGFMAARGDWKEEAQGRNAQVALSVLISFFDKAL